MVAAKYDEPTGKWHVTIKRPSSSGEGGSSIDYEEFEDTADLLFTGVGGLSRWNWPDIDGLNDFKGTMVHSANWEIGKESVVSSGGSDPKPSWEEDVKDWGSKRVAVIGVVSAPLFDHTLIF